MPPNRQPDATAVSPGQRRSRAWGDSSFLRLRWPSVAALVITYVLSGVANAGSAWSGDRPGIPGTLASAAFLAAWVWYAVASVRPGWPGPKLASIYWGIAIVGLVLAGPLLRVQGLGEASGSGWTLLVTIGFLLVAVPIHGIAGLWLVDRQWLVLAAVAAVSYLVIVATAAVAKRRLRAGVRL